MEKTLLTPLRQSSIPQEQRHVPMRYQKSWAYQEDNGRYFLATFTPINIPPHPSDTLYVLEAKDVARPDIISYAFYGTPSLYWIILWLNNITDPFEGMYPGMLLRIPTFQRLGEYGVR